MVCGYFLHHVCFIGYLILFVSLKARYIVELHDWLMFRLTERWALSLATISGEWPYVTEWGGWPLDLLEVLDLGDRPDRCPASVLQPVQLVGKLTIECSMRID